MPFFHRPVSQTVDLRLPEPVLKRKVMQRSARMGLALCAFLALSACFDKEKRAESYYQSALELIAEGDETRAILEFKNVFKYNGFHKEARRTYAELLLKQGNVSGAYSQLLRLIEQYPDTLDVRQQLAQMALDLGNWEELERHAEAAIALAPEDPINRDLQLVLGYRTAAQARDTERLADLGATAQIRLERTPQNLVLLRVVVDQLNAQKRYDEVLPYLETALQLSPNNYDLHKRKLRILNELERPADVGAQLQHMVALFPQADELKTALVRWFLLNQDQAGAIDFLRREAGPRDGETAGHLQLVQFLNAIAGRDTGLAELEELIAANAGTAKEATYIAFRATMAFEVGAQDQAISDLRAILATPEGANNNEVKALLARMLDNIGNRSEAQALVAEILADDAGNVEALKLEAGWAIISDRTNDAILNLRSALNQAPRDAGVMSLLAAAHERDGNKELTGEYLSKAVEFSNAGAEQSLRYARFLLAQGRVQSAESILTDSLRAAPGNVPVLTALGQVLLESRQWARAGEVANILSQAEDPDARQNAARIRAAILLLQNRIEEGLDLLETAAAGNNDNIRPTLVVVLTQIRAGKTAEAREFLNSGLEKFPNSLPLLLLDASLYAVMGQPELAEPAYKALLAQYPTEPAPPRLFYGFLRGEGRAEDASAMLAAALEKQPDNPDLLKYRAGELELSGDIEATIDIYERLYAADSSDIVLVNNLSSMLATYRSDADSLERAYLISRRLRGTSFAPFQDTLGWIQYRRGDLEEALSYLEPAAEGLAQDPIVQFHLGMVYAGLGRTEDAITQFERAIELGDGRSLTQLDQARDQLKALSQTQ